MLTTARKIQRSSQHVAEISSTSSTYGARYPTLWLSTVSVFHAATRPRRRTWSLETATCVTIRRRGEPVPSACATTTDLVSSHLKRRAAVLIDVRALPVRAPRTTSRSASDLSPAACNS